MEGKDIERRIPIGERPPEERIKDFEEVCLGYTKEEAIAEAKRCLTCSRPLCVEGCPVGINIPAFISYIKEGNFPQALEEIKKKNLLPSICGRVCPSEYQCESKCVLGKIGAPIAIGALERAASDYGEENHLCEGNSPSHSVGRVAVIGSGPAGLTCAAELARSNIEVVVFEALHEFGGVLSYGIPSFRLPRRIIQKQIETLKAMGVKLEKNILVGRTIPFRDLLMKEKFQAVFIATGAGLPQLLGINGENLEGVYSANEYLTRVNLMRADQFPRYGTPIKRGKRVAVIGGGNVAIDAARVALRLSAEEVYIVYRRTEEEMPARRVEIEHAKEEGIKFLYLLSPIEIKGNGEKELVCKRMALLDERDASGRRKVRETEEIFNLKADVIIIAIGQKPNPLIPSLEPTLRRGKEGEIIVDEEMRTSLEAVWAGGDIASGAATVIMAMGMAKKAAESIKRYLGVT
ncbi:NADPH-dependent glutamate synthase [bacterium]|nr:NADPH-dependent glutamate synthase [bacterium]